MAETIDSLLVELGLDTDKQSFNEAGQIFTGLRSKALLFGAAIGTIGAAIGGVTASFANDVDRMGKFAEVYDTTAQNVNRLGFALEKSGGSAEDAFGSIQRLRDLQARWRQGDFPDSAAFFGIDPNVLQSTGDLLRDYERLAGAVQGMGATQRRDALQSLGFSDAEIKLFGDGIGTMRRYFREADKFSTVTAEMTRNAADFKDSVTDLSEAVEGVKNIIGNELSPSMTRLNERFANFLVEYGGPAAETAAQGVNKLLDNTEDEFTFLFQWADNIKRELEMIRSGQGGQVATESVERVLGYLGLGDYVSRSRARAEEYGRSREGEASEDGGFRFFNEPPSTSFGDNNTVNTYNISVDARGASSPQAVEGAATRAIQKALQSNARNAIKDTRTPAR